MNKPKEDWQDAVKHLYAIRLVQDKYPNISFRNFGYWFSEAQNRSADWLMYYRDLCHKIFSNVYRGSFIGFAKEVRHIADWKWMIEKHSSEPTLDHLMSVIKLAGFDEHHIFGLYKYGSRVYGCANEASDFDYILVVDRPVSEDKQPGLIGTGVDINVINITRFLHKLDLHDIDALECAFLYPKDVFINRIDFDGFIFNKVKLRHSISDKASHSFVKAKKKLTVEKDLNPYIGKKSLFHSLRIINFGTQIATHGKIIDYSAANNFWDEIVNNPNNDWQYYKEKYQPIYNNMMTEFRKLAPKEL